MSDCIYRTGKVLSVDLPETINSLGQGSGLLWTEIKLLFIIIQ